MHPYTRESLHFKYDYTHAGSDLRLHISALSQTARCRVFGFQWLFLGSLLNWQALRDNNRTSASYIRVQLKYDIRHTCLAVAAAAAAATHTHIA